MFSFIRNKESNQQQTINNFGVSHQIQNQQAAIFSDNSSVLKQWAQQHKIEKHAGIGIITSLARKVGLVVSLVLVTALAFPLPAMGIYNLIIFLKEKYLISYKPKSILTAIRKMKTQEETDKLNTMKDVLSDSAYTNLKILPSKQAAKELTKDIKNHLSSSDLQKNRSARYILRALSQKDYFNPEWINVLKNPEMVKELSFNDPESFFTKIQESYSQLDLGDLRSLDWQTLSHKAEKPTISSKKMDEEIQRFEHSLRHLLTDLKTLTSVKHPTSANRELIKNLRKCLSSPIYQALKQDSTEPSVKLLQRLASDIWNKAPSMDAYRDLGESVMKNTSLDESKQEGEDLAKQLEKSHEKMGKLHYTAHGLLGMINYGLTHPVQTLGGLASEGGAVRHIPGMVGRDEYDSHGTLSNNPSLQGITHLQLKNGQKAKVHNCYGGSPTIGDHKIAPEFEAVLQAAENNQLASSAFRDAVIPLMVNYNNLQNLEKITGEGPRSRAIMLLNKKYPLSFKGTTFSKDSNFYLMNTPESVVWTGEPHKFGEKMQAQLERSFDPNEKGHGFYFHGPLEKWQPIFRAIIENANEHFEILKKDQPDLWDKLNPIDLQGAYQEYAYSLLNAVIEMQAVQMLVERGIEEPTVMAITACKENIDRGGMENTKYLYLKLTNTEEDKLPLIVGAMYSRALSARDRLILKSRMPQILNFMKVIEPQAFKNKQMELFDTLGYSVDKSTYHPYLKTRVQSAA